LATNSEGVGLMSVQDFKPMVLTPDTLASQMDGWTDTQTIYNCKTYYSELGSK